MIKKFRLLVGLLLLAPAMAHALGLGDIRLGSALNQPLSADIEIVGASTDALGQVSAGVLRAIQGDVCLVGAGAAILNKKLNAIAGALPAIAQKAESLPAAQRKPQSAAIRRR